MSAGGGIVRSEMIDVVVAAQEARDMASGARVARDAAALLGGKAALARALGCSATSVQRWCHSVDPIPPWMPQALEAVDRGVAPPRSTIGAVQAAIDAGWNPAHIGMLLGVTGPYVSAVALGLVRLPAAFGIAVANLPPPDAA